MEMRKWLQHEELWRAVKFGLTGVANTLVDYLVFTVLVILNVNVYFSQICSFSAGMLNSYLVNRRWTFQSKQRFFSLQIVKFILANLSVLAVSMLLLKLFIDFAGWPVLIAKLGAVCITMVLNFIISRLWVFR